MKKKFLILAILLMAIVPVISCGSKKPLEDSGKEDVLIINMEEGSVSFLAEINGKYFHEPTRHCAVFKDGKNGNKSIFRSLADQKSFYDALLKINAKPGENMTLENKEKTRVKGDSMNVSVSWKGSVREYSLDEVIKDSNSKKINMKFGGNIQRAMKINTGCLLCLDSCPVGIVSNDVYTYGSVEKRGEVSFTGNKDLLPPDGSLVTIKVKLANK